MTVRLTPTESDNTPPSHSPSPPDPTDESVAAPTGDPSPPESEDRRGGTSEEQVATDDPADPPDAGSGGVDSRVAVREARRQRRRVAWLCAAIVAISLGLTIVVVSLARTRPAPAPGAVVSSALAVPYTHASGSSSLSPDPFPGAPAPEGGHP